MSRTITTVGLDADDTLWHNETIFRLTHDRFAALLADRADPEEIDSRLAATEQRNLRLYGYGVKGFTLSMIETAMELCGGEPPSAAIREILAAGREMLAHPVETLPGVDEALAVLSERYRLVLITKGDLMDQERKLAASGLGADTYTRVFERHGSGAAEAVMAGNSMKSDVLPAIKAGAFGVHIPYTITWAHELADAPVDEPRFGALETLDQLPAWIAACER